MHTPALERITSSESGPGIREAKTSIKTAAIAGIRYAIDSIMDSLAAVRFVANADTIQYK
jgi:hypothetical protein